MTERNQNRVFNILDCRWVGPRGKMSLKVYVSGHHADLGGKLILGLQGEETEIIIPSSKIEFFEPWQDLKEIVTTYLSNGNGHNNNNGVKES